MESGSTFEYVPSGLPDPDRRIMETPPEWWDEYPFDASDPDWDSIDPYENYSNSFAEGPAIVVVGPNCIPQPISTIAELQYITPISNLDSILTLGILSHSEAKTVFHTSVANAEINSMRADKRLSSGKSIHDYVNLFFNARNPMLFRCFWDYDHGSNPNALCILKVAHTVLWRSNVLVTDGNAAHHRTTDAPLTAGSVMLDRRMVYAKSWNSASQSQKDENTRCMMAEVLIPNRVPPVFIKTVYFRNESELQLAGIRVGSAPFEVNPRSFFDQSATLGSSSRVKP
jgi:hypothetical protein